jgi:hypothetical protein
MNKFFPFPTQNGLWKTTFCDIKKAIREIGKNICEAPLRKIS